LTGGEAAVRQLEREGVEVAFGIPGVHTLALYDALIGSDIDHVTARHEQGAGFMADGYARATGRPAALFVITGPGLANAATPVAQAYSDSAPMLVISSHHATAEADRGQGLLHELKDQAGVMEDIVARSERVDRVSDVPGAIASAMDRLESGRPRPVHVDVPLDVFDRRDAVGLAPPPADRTAARARPRPSPDRVEAAADAVSGADAPVLLAGGGCSGPEATAAVRRLVDEVGLPVVTTTAGKGVVPAAHPRHAGTTERAAAADVLAAGDLLLAVGTELSPRDVSDVDLPDEVVRVDIDYGGMMRTHEPDVGIVADAAAGVGALADELDGRAGVGADAADPDVPGAADPSPLWPTEETWAGSHRILAALRDALDDDAVVAADMTKIGYASRPAYPAAEPRTFLFPRGFGTLGYSPPAAVGAAVGAPDRQAVALVGDGGFMFTVQALATAVAHDIGVPIIVCNDEAYGVIEESQMRRYGRTVGVDIENPDFVALAESFGAAGQRLDPAGIDETLEPALDAAFERDRPTLVEIPVEF